MKFALKLIAILLGVTALILSVPVLMYFPGYNFATVQDGGFYRCRQINGAPLERTIRKYGIQTVINLRGHNPGQEWYDDEVAVCQKLGIAHEDFAWSRSAIPDPESLVRFVAMVEAGQQPFLAHCQGGTHRTGVASACYQLLQGADIPTARKQFGPMFKNAPIGQVLDLYQGSDMPFAQWVREVYPAQYQSLKGAADPAPSAAPLQPAA